MSILHRLLTITVMRTHSQQRAEGSRFVWGSDGASGYRLSVLGVINGLLPSDVRLVRVVHRIVATDDSPASEGKEAQ